MSNVIKLKSEIWNDSLPRLKSDGSIATNGYLSKFENGLSANNALIQADGYTMSASEKAAVEAFIARGIEKGWIEHIMYANAYVGVSGPDGLTPLINNLKNVDGSISDVRISGTASSTSRYLEVCSTFEDGGVTKIYGVGGTRYQRPFSIYSLVNKNFKFKNAGKAEFTIDYFFDDKENATPCYIAGSSGQKEETGAAIILAARKMNTGSFGSFLNVNNTSIFNDGSKAGNDKPIFVSEYFSNTKALRRVYDVNGELVIDKIHTYNDLGMENILNAKPETSDFYINAVFVGGYKETTASAASLSRPNVIPYTSFTDGLMTDTQMADYAAAVCDLVVGLGKVSVS